MGTHQPNRNEMKKATVLALVALAFCAVTAEENKNDEPAAPAVEVPQELLQTATKGQAQSKFMSPFMSPYSLNPLLYFGAGFATPFLFGGMASGQMSPMAQTGMMPQPMQLPMMAQVGAEAKAKTAAGAGAGANFYGFGGYPYGGMGYGM